MPVRSAATRARGVASASEENNHVLHTVNLESGNWTALGGGGGLADGGPPSTTSSSSSSFRTIASQELNLLMPESVPWWPRHGEWVAWLQRNGTTETTREFNAKLDVTPETNDTSTSEVAHRMRRNARVSFAWSITWISLLILLLSVPVCSMFLRSHSATSKPILILHVWLFDIPRSSPRDLLFFLKGAG